MGSRLPPWRRSPYDEQLHLIHHEVSDVAEAYCEHSVPSDKLEDPGDAEGPRCQTCIMMFAYERAQKLPGEAGLWAP